MTATECIRENWELAAIAVVNVLGTVIPLVVL